MKYKITLSEDETFVRLRVFEAVNGKMAREFVGYAIKEARRHRTRRFLGKVLHNSEIKNYNMEGLLWQE